MWLPWKIAAACALALGGIGWWPGAGRVPPLGARVRPWVRELAIVFALYTAWQRLGEVSFTSTAGAVRRGRDLWDLERALRLPNEVTLQRWTLKATWLARTANLYYIVVHVAPVGVWLAWLFARHRDRYRRWRTTFFVATIATLTVQWLPVAPPRFYPELGFVDTGALLGPRVYDDAGAGTVGQLSAMPSMHVAWACALGLSVFLCARSRWRWLGPAHALLTVWAVTVTGYHWLADALVAAAIVGIVALTVGGWERWRRAATASTGAQPPPRRRRRPPVRRTARRASG